MATTSKYFVLTPNADHLNVLDFDLNYGSVTTVGETVQYSGSAKVDSVFVRPGLAFDLSTTGGATDKIYFTGNLSDYARTVAASSQTLTLSRTANGLGESIKVSGGTPLVFDNLVFANGLVSANALYAATANASALPPPNAAETSLAPQGAAASSASLNASIKAYSTNPAAVAQVGTTFASTRPGISLTVFGGNGIDTVYAADGAVVDASITGASVDLVYFRGNWADYTKSVLSGGTKLLFTRTVTGHRESVTVSAGTALNFDRLIFADGTINTIDAKNLLIVDPTSPGPVDPGVTTPLYTNQEVLDAITTIRDAAQANNATASTPTALTYKVAGSSGVDAGNLGAMNSALNSGPIDGNAVDTAPEIQTLLSAYKAILAEANGATPSTGTALTGTQYSSVGVTGVSGSAAAGNALFLLDDVVGNSAATDLDTVPELQAMADAAAHVLAAAGGSLAQATALTQTDLGALGITGVNAGNIAAIQAALQGTASNTLIDTQAELQSIVTLASNAPPSLGSTLSGVSNLEVSSNLVFSASQTLRVGSGLIRITDMGGTAYQGDSNTNSQTIDVASAVTNGLLSISGSGASTTIIINPQWDLDLASTYQISIDDGAFWNGSGTQAAVHLAPLTFGTVTPGNHSGGSAATEAVASQTMVNATGALTAGKSWLSIQGIGNNTGSVTQLGDLSGGAFALVMKNYATTRGGTPALGGDGTDGIASHDTNIGVTNFGNNDLVYFDSQVNNASLQFFDAHYTALTDGGSVGGLAGQNALVLGLVSTPVQQGSSAMLLLGLEGNTANTLYPAIFTLDASNIGWANVWHAASAPVVMG
jgi:hypothetical protein